MEFKKLIQCFMAFATGKESTDEVKFKNYIGIAPVFILGVNPNKEELEKIYGRTLDKEPEYVGKTTIGQDENKKEVEQIRIDFIVKTDPKFKDCDIETISKVSFYLANSYRYNGDRNKVQMINVYGETAWIPVEDAKAGKTPDNMSWYNTEGMRPLFIGEEELISFIKNYLGIPNRSYKDNKTGETITIPDVTEAQASFTKDEITAMIKGNVAVLRQVINGQPNNKIKVMFGVKSVEGKEYQTIFNLATAKNNASNYDRIKKVLEEKLAVGAFATTTFSTDIIHEYTVVPTESSSFSVEETEDSPW